MGLIASAVRQTGLVDFAPDQIKFLMYGRIGDVDRLKKQFGYTPEFTTEEAFKDFIAKRKIAKIFTNEQAAQWERDLYEFLARRGYEGAPEPDAEETEKV
jgi:UDP-glucose 4-epimerase